MIGSSEFVFLLLYIDPHTYIVGAVFLAALLGNAIATQMRMEHPLFSHFSFGVYLGLVMLSGLRRQSIKIRHSFLLFCRRRQVLSHWPERPLVEIPRNSYQRKL